MQNDRSGRLRAGDAERAAADLPESYKKPNDCNFAQRRQGEVQLDHVQAGAKGAQVTV